MCNCWGWGGLVLFCFLFLSRAFSVVTYRRFCGAHCWLLSIRDFERGWLLQSDVAMPICKPHFLCHFFFSESLNSHKSGCFGFSTELLPLIVPHNLSSVWNEALLFEYVLEERQVVKVRSLLTVGIHKLLHWLSPQICLVQGSV